MEPVYVTTEDQLADGVTDVTTCSTTEMSGKIYVIVYVSISDDQISMVYLSYVFFSMY